MASSLSSSENLVTGFEAMGDFSIDEAFLKSLLDETSQVEEPEDERLGYVMRSLEAEIDPKVTDNRAPAVVPELGIQGKCENYRSDQYFGLEDGFDWLDHMEMAPSSLGAEMGNWYMDSGAYTELAGMVEFGEVRDYSHLYYTAPMEEHAYSSLWQETYDSVMYD